MSTMVTSNDALMTTKSVAKFLGYSSIKSVRELVKKGHLKPRYIPGTRRPRFLSSQVRSLVREEPYTAPCKNFLGKPHHKPNKHNGDDDAE